jgi:hypothetical protein
VELGESRESDRLRQIAFPMQLISSRWCEMARFMKRWGSVCAPFKNGQDAP